MKVAIDSYCYHRYFGECYPGLQTRPKKPMTVWDFLKRARRHGVEGVSLEACYLPTADAEFLDKLRETLDRYGFERVWAWGHPEGLRSGTDRTAAEDLRRHLDYAEAIGARVMRIVGGSRRSRPTSWPLHRRRLARMLSPLARQAEKRNITLALENHIDMRADEIAELVGAIGSPGLGICLDTGNNLRLFEDPLMVAEKLAPWTRATHIKDIGVRPGNPQDFAFWPSVPLGAGLVHIPTVIRFLRQAGYRGLLAIEVDFLDPRYGEEDRAVGQSVRYLRRLVQNPRRARA
jgi:sugar phosphate isomerase/epimerase